MGRSFRRIALRGAIALMVPLLLPTTGWSQTPDPIILSEQEMKTIAVLLDKRQVRFDDAERIAYVDPGLWYAVDREQKKNLTILLARRLAAENKVYFSAINIHSALTGRKLATYMMFEGFKMEE
jgi:hypothetical protein